MLDNSKRNYFRYDMEDVLRTSSVPPEFHNSLIQQLWARGSRESVDDARDHLREKLDEGLVDEETMKLILDIIRNHSTYR